MGENINNWSQRSNALKDAVYKKLETEFGLYREWLLCKTKEEMLTYSHGYNLREDILNTFDDTDFSDEDLQKMLKTPSLLDKVLEAHRKDACCTSMYRALLEDDLEKVVKSL